MNSRHSEDKASADWLVVNSYALKHSVEEKSAAEALNSYSSWWSSWKKKEEVIKNYKLESVRVNAKPGLSLVNVKDLDSVK